MDRVKVLLQAHNHHYKHLGELMVAKDKSEWKHYLLGSFPVVNYGGKRIQKGVQVWEQIVQEIYLLSTLTFSFAVVVRYIIILGYWYSLNQNLGITEVLFVYWD